MVSSAPPDQRLVQEVGSRRVDRALLRLAPKAEMLSAYPKAAEIPGHVQEAMLQGLTTYEIPPGSGLSELRECLGYLMGVDSPTARVENVTVTAGAMSAIHTLWISIASNGGQVVVPTPSYFVEGSIRLAGLVPRAIRAVDSVSWDWEAIEAAFNATTVGCFFSNPNNPTGACFGKEDVEQLAECAGRHPEVLFVVDESYERIVYEPGHHMTSWALSDTTRNLAVVRSFSKSFALPQIRIGWVVAHAEISAHLSMILEWHQLFGAGPNQRAAWSVLTHGQDWLESAFETFHRNRGSITSLLRRIPGVAAPTPSGGPFVYVDVADVPAQSLDFDEIWRHGVPAVPGPSFGGTDTEMRIPFGGDADLIASSVRSFADWLRN